MKKTHVICLAFCISLILSGQLFASDRQSTPLEQTRKWLFKNPPNGNNGVLRRKHMAEIQKVCDLVSPETWFEYRDTWNVDVVCADSLEKANPALDYLHTSTLDAITDLRNTQVKNGVAVWFIYNMGYVFKTPTACFGVDLCGRDVELLAPDLDFLLVSHEHNDHNSDPLIKAMIQKEKSVITRDWRWGSTMITQSSKLNFGEIHVKIDVGDHHCEKPDQRGNMLMFEIDCGPSGNHFIVYHSGDGNNYNKMNPSKKIDLFIVHANVGMSVPDAIAHIKPAMTFVSHVMEMGHSPKPPNAWRWSYDYAFEVIGNIPEKKATVLTWGEKWVAPGTLFEE